MKLNPALCVLAFAISGSGLLAADSLPRIWIDPETGHRIVQLSNEPDTSSLYFTQNGYCANGTKVVLVRKNQIELATLNTGEVETIYRGPLGRVVEAGRKSGKVYFNAPGALWCVDPATHEAKQLAAMPPNGSIRAINCDETLALGMSTEGGDWSAQSVNNANVELKGDAEGRKYSPGHPQPGTDDYPDKMDAMIRRFGQRRPMTLFTIDLKTGACRELIHSTDWLNHLQFSPVDPRQFSFCHEGPWWMLDRVWLMRTEGQTDPVLVHKRTMRAEIANHEYWSADGQWLWYDLQTPMNEDFWVAGYNVRTTERVWYHLTVDQWSIHYNRSPDGTLFSGDGGQPGHLGPQPKNSKYLFLFHPVMIPDPAPAPPQAGLIRVGTFRTERLASLANHDYSLEPNGNFSPDGKWVVFRSNMRGPIQVYAVEVAKTFKSINVPDTGF